MMYFNLDFTADNKLVLTSITKRKVSTDVNDLSLTTEEFNKLNKSKIIDPNKLLIPFGH